MQIRFFVGKNDNPVTPEKSNDNAANHYAWCIQLVVNGLKNAKSDKDRLDILENFITHMKSSTATSKMITEEIEGILRVMMDKKPLPANNEIISWVMGIPVGSNMDYLTYSEPFAASSSTHRK